MYNYQIHGIVILTSYTLAVHVYMLANLGKKLLCQLSRFQLMHGQFTNALWGFDFIADKSNLQQADNVCGLIYVNRFLISDEE